MAIVEIAESGPLTRDESHRLAECEKAIDCGRKSFVTVGNALLEICESRLYRANHATFEAYCRDRWDYAKATAYQFISAVKVVKNVRNCGQTQPILTENQARQLARLPEEKQTAAWEAAVKNSNGTPTANQIKRVVEQMSGKTSLNGKQKPHALKTDREAREQAREKRASEILRMGRHRLTLPLSERALLCREATSVKIPRDKALIHFDIKNDMECQRAIRITQSGRKLLIDAMNNDRAPIGAIDRYLKMTDQEAIADLERYDLKKAAKNHKPLSTTGRSPMQLYHDLLERTWTNWSGFRDNYKINSKVVPKVEEKRAEWRLLCANVRAVVNSILDKLDEEMR